jgi:very-short-patch-repair endonuclease
VSAEPTGPNSRNFSRDARIRDLAARQHGVVERGQLLAAGLAVWEVDNRVRNGRLERLHRAVYRVPGPVRGRWEAEMAAVLACGEGALASHGTAAQLLTLPLPASPDGRTEVLVVDAYRRPGPTVRVRRVARLDAADRAMANGVPVTGAARTLLDMAGRVRPRTLEHAVAWAGREGVAEREALVDVVARYPRSRGAGALRALLGRDAPPAFVRSGGEARLLDLIDEAGLPRPKTNAMVQGFEVDCVWPEQRLMVELDGRRYHERDPAFDRDRRRDAALTLAGYRVIRLAWPQIRDEKVATAGLLVRAFYDVSATRGGGPPGGGPPGQDRWG